MNDFDRDDLQKIVDKCNSKTDFAKELGYRYYNGQVAKKINDIVSVYNISIEHFDPYFSNRKRLKYKIIVKLCPICNKRFETKKGHKKEKSTCSVSCANSYFYELRYSEASNKKRAESVTKDPYKKACVECKNQFKTKKKKQKFCSISCVGNNWKQEDYRKNIIDQAKKRVSDGTHKG